MLLNYPVSDASGRDQIAVEGATSVIAPEVTHSFSRAFFLKKDLILECACYSSA